MCRGGREEHPTPTSCASWELDGRHLHLRVEHAGPEALRVAGMQGTVDGTVDRLAGLYSREASALLDLGTAHAVYRRAPPVYVFMHVGKAGGTTIDGVVGDALLASNVPYVGYFHFDWSWIERYHMHRATPPRVLVVLRDPLSRAVSEFYFARTLDWTAGMKIREHTLDSYFGDVDEMMKTRGVWQDGEAAMSWFAGAYAARPRSRRPAHLTRPSLRL